MNQELITMTEKWKSLERKTEKQRKKRKYEPLVRNIQLLQPQRILFLYTEKTEYIPEKIVKYCRLDAMRFKKREVSGTDPLDIYREIKAAFPYLFPLILKALLTISKSAFKIKE